MLRAWGAPVLLGVLQAGALFLFIAWIQPDLSGSQRIELPRAVRLSLQGGAREKVSRARSKAESSSRDRREETRSQKRQPPRKITASKSASAARVGARSPGAGKLDVPRTIALGSLGAVGGGASMAINLSSEDAGIAQQMESHKAWQERRERIRSGDAVAERGRPGGAGRQRSGQQVEITLGGGGNEAYLPEPAYPEEAKRKQITGFVDMRLLISITGAVLKHEITGAQPVGIFEKAVIEILPRWKFPPALDESGKPIEYWEEFRYEFRLENANL